MREERFWMSKETLTKKTNKLFHGRNMEDSTNNGTSSMLINIQEIQRRANSTETSVCMLIEPSILFLNSDHTDISKLSMEETLLLRPETVEKHNNGGSIKDH
jgi:hypothetical protein